MRNRTRVELRQLQTVRFKDATLTGIREQKPVRRDETKQVRVDVPVMMHP